MASTPVSGVLRHLRSMLAVTASPEATDAELLDAFVARHEQSAFAALLCRHGPMVLSVSRRQVEQIADAEDVFQATFLLLARNARHIRKHGSVGSWLHGVAYRLAARARTQQKLRQLHEQRAASLRATPPHIEAARREVQDLLDEALAQLPEKYRTALVLCYLEGMTQEEAARQLGCPLGTVRGWLARGRGLLRKRLMQRGLTLSAGAFVALLAASTASARVMSPLFHATLTAAMQGIAGTAATAVAPPVAALVEGGQAMMSGVRWKLMLTLVLALVMTATGAVVYPLLASAQPGQQAKPPASDAGPPAPAANSVPDEPLPPGAVARIGSMRDRHGNFVMSVAFSPDSKLLASGSWDHSVRLVEVATGKEVRRLTLPENGMAAVAFAPDGKTLATGCGDKLIRLWDLATGKELRQLQGHESTVASVAFSPDGKTLASGGWDKTVRLWDLATGNALRRLQGHEEVAGQVAFSPDGKLLVSGSRDKTVRLWDVATGKQVQQMTAGNSVESVAFAPDGKMVAAGSYDNTISLWDVTTGKNLQTLSGHEHWVYSVAFSPDGKLLASGSIDRGIRLWDLATGKEVRRWPAHSLGVFSVAFSPDGKMVASGSEDHTTAIWEVATGKEIRRPGQPQHRITGLAYAPDGKRLATGTWDEDVILWDLATRQPLRRFSGQKGTHYSVAFSPDGKTVVSAGTQRTVRLWEVASGNALFRWQTAGAEVGAVAFSPDGKRVAAGDNGNRVYLWESTGGKLVRQIDLPSDQAAGQVSWLAFAPDGQTLFTTGQPGSAGRQWSVATGKELRSFSTSRYRPALSPDGKVLVTLSGDPKIQVWETATGLLRCSIPNDRQNDLGIACSPDLRTLATFDLWGRTVAVWDLFTGERFAQFKGQHGPVTCLQFSPDGRTLASGSLDNTVVIWEVPRPAAPRPRALSPDDLKGLWTDLASADPSRIFQAMRDLATSSRQAVPFLKEQVRPAVAMAAPDGKRLAQWIQDLDSDQFKVRQKALAELEAMESVAEPALREALTGRPSLEVRRQCERLLEKLEKRAGEPEALRLRRAIEVLETTGTQEAGEVLKAIAGGAPEARLTWEANEARKRLARKQ